MLDRFFDEDARRRIAAAVAVAEGASLGQLVPVVVERSDGYPEARYRGAILGVAIATGIVLALRLPLTLAELPLVQLFAGVVGGLAALWDPLERLLAGRTELDLATRERALRAFHEHGLHRTAEGTGVLVFASLFERRAIVLGDAGIHARMGEREWQRAVDALVRGMRSGDPATGFCEAISLCGAKLAEHFPRVPGRPGPVNELSDALRSSRD